MNRVKIALFGDVMVDHYIYGSTSRISPEAPVPVIHTTSEEDLIGGAGNVLRNLVALHADVYMFSIVGNDRYGKYLKSEIENLAYKAYILTHNRKTTVKNRILAKNQQIVRFDIEEIEEIDTNTADEVLSIFRDIVDEVDFVLMSDYAKGFLTEYLCRNIIEISTSSNRKVLIDPKGKNFFKYRGAYGIKPNRAEALEIFPDATIEEAGKRISKEFQIENVVITLSEHGMALFQKESMEVFPTKAKDIFDVTGAGDTVLASLGVALANGYSWREAIHFANSAAAVVIGKAGSAVATLEEVRRYSQSREKIITSPNEIERSGRLVFTNGCFDILHIGHIRYLRKAKQLGDILVVGVNSDESVRRIKGTKRPIIPENERVEMLAALEFVDYVILFNEDTPYELIKKISPHILVKGADYKNKTVVGSDLVDEVVLIDYIENRSTSSIIKKIVERYS